MTTTPSAAKLGAGVAAGAKDAAADAGEEVPKDYVGPGSGAPSRLRNTAPLRAEDAALLHSAAMPTKAGYIGKAPDNTWWEDVPTVESLVEQMKSSDEPVLRGHELVDACSTIRRNAQKYLQDMSANHQAFIRNQIEWEGKRREPLYLASAKIEESMRNKTEKTVTIGKKQLVYSELFL